MRTMKLILETSVEASRVTFMRCISYGDRRLPSPYCPQEQSDELGIRSSLSPALRGFTREMIFCTETLLEAFPSWTILIG